ncbi:MAG: methyltransferase domain-containing protein [Thermoleophilaceae bacterium]|nr:methyltransferase domain-containing protein [Thermoleophilaceae bacterium]
MDAAEEIRDANVRYHDLAAATYDSKWGIDYEAVGGQQVVGKLGKALGRAPGHYPRALEIGAGTGYFILNLMRAGLVERGVATDISAGMLAVLSETAGRLALDVETACCEAAELPFEDDSFDLVVGHAVLHHLPDLDAAFREFRRVLRPGGVVAFCGEPSRYGDRLARLPKRGAHAVAPLWRALLGADERVYGENGHLGEEDTLEAVVDVHAFTPSALSAHARSAGLEDIRVRGEELAASLFGWANRALEATAVPEDIPRVWRMYAYRGYLLLQALDRSLLEPRLPPAIFYNLLLSARAPD